MPIWCHCPVPLDTEDRWSNTWPNVASRHKPGMTERSDVCAGGGRRTGLGKEFIRSSRKQSITDTPFAKTTAKNVKRDDPNCLFLPVHGHFQTHLNLLKCVSICFSLSVESVAGCRCRSWVSAIPVGEWKFSFIFTLWPKHLCQSRASDL